MGFPLEFARGCFPALVDSDSVFFNHALEPQVLGSVLRAQQDDGAGTSPGQILNETRESLAVFLNSNEKWAEDEILFGPDPAELVRRLSLALEKEFEPGTEILLTDLDDEDVLAPWLALAERGVTSKFWSFQRPDGGLNLDKLDDLLSEKTRLLAVTKASQTMGTVVELLPLALRMRDREGYFLTNWTPFVAHGAIDIRFLRGDFVVASAAPLFGPRIAFLWGKREHLTRFREQSPELFEGLSVNSRAVAGLRAALDYVEELGIVSGDLQLQPSEDFGRRKHMRRGMQAIRHYEHELCSLLLRRMGNVPGLRVYGVREYDRAALRTPNVYFQIGELEPETVAGRLAENDIVVGSGVNGTPRTAKALGLPEKSGAVLASLAHYNTEREIERFAEALHDLA